jgi:hypothetical protein
MRLASREHLVAFYEGYGPEREGVERAWEKAKLTIYIVT